MDYSKNTKDFPPLILIDSDSETETLPNGEQSLDSRSQNDLQTEASALNASEHQATSSSYTNQYDNNTEASDSELSGTEFIDSLKERYGYYSRSTSDQASTSAQTNTQRTSATPSPATALNADHSAAQPSQLDNVTAAIQQQVGENVATNVSLKHFLKTTNPADWPDILKSIIDQCREQTVKQVLEELNKAPANGSPHRSETDGKSKKIRKRHRHDSHHRSKKDKRSHHSSTSKLNDSTASTASTSKHSGRKLNSSFIFSLTVFIFVR